MFAHVYLIGQCTTLLDDVTLLLAKVSSGSAYILDCAPWTPLNKDLVSVRSLAECSKNSNPPYGNVTLIFYLFYLFMLVSPEAVSTL